MANTATQASNLTTRFIPRHSFLEARRPSGASRCGLCGQGYCPRLWLFKEARSSSIRSNCNGHQSEIAVW